MISHYDKDLFDIPMFIHFLSTSHFYTHWKRQKTTFSEGI